MTLQAQGFRFVQRGQQWLWVPWQLMQPGDVDCTDMDDEMFERAVLAACAADTSSGSYTAEPDNSV